MKERGKVVGFKKDKALVRMERRASCKDCNMCGFGANEKFVDLVCDNESDAKEGDLVEVQFSVNAVTKAISVVYVLPIILAGLSLLITSLLKCSEGVQLIVALLSLLSCVLFIYLFEKVFRKKKYLPKIVKIVGEGDVV